MILFLGLALCYSCGHLFLSLSPKLINQGQNSDMGEGGIKNDQKKSYVFYGRPHIKEWLETKQSSFLRII